VKDLATAVLETLRDRGELTFYRLDPIIQHQGYVVGIPLARVINTLEHDGLIAIEKRGDHSYYSITARGLKELQSRAN